MTPHVVVVGGGITGLGAAHRLSSAGDIDISLIEAADRLGGKILTSAFADRAVDEGADAFLVRVPWALDLCAELGMADQLVSPAAHNAYVWSRGELRPLPDAHVLGVPTDLDALRSSGAVDDDAVTRAAEDLDARVHHGDPLSAGGPDETVGAMVRRRLGDQVAERLVGPLVGGIFAGDVDRLSLAACAPQLDAAARADPSLIRALREQRRGVAADPAAPIFATHPGGMGRLVDALVAAMPAVDIRTGARVDVEPGPVVTVRSSTLPNRAGFRTETVRKPAQNETMEVDGVIVAVPAPAAAELIRPIEAGVADELAAVEHASVALVTLAVPRAAVGRALDASGYLVPRAEGLVLTACSWASSKWAHLDDGDTVVLRASAGRDGDATALDLDDGDLVERLVDDLARTMDLRGAPTEVRVSRWPAGFPQYRPGHLDRVAIWERRLADVAPTVVLAGAAYRGVGIPACIRSGRAAADRLLGHLAGDR